MYITAFDINEDYIFHHTCLRKVFPGEILILLILLELTKNILSEVCFKKKYGMMELAFNFKFGTEKDILTEMLPSITHKLEGKTPANKEIYKEIRDLFKKFIKQNRCPTGKIVFNVELLRKKKRQTISINTFIQENIS